MVRVPTPCELTKSLEEQIKELKLQNKELERQKADKLLEEKLYQLKLRNLELARQIGQEDQANQEKIGQEKTGMMKYRVFPLLQGNPQYTRKPQSLLLFLEIQTVGEAI